MTIADLHRRGLSMRTIATTTGRSPWTTSPMNPGGTWFTTIYQAVYRPELGALHREVPKALRTGRRRRKLHRRGDERRGRLVNMTMIDQCPVEADDRATPG